MTISAPKADNVTFRLRARKQGETFQTKFRQETFQRLEVITFGAGFLFPPKTDIKITGVKISGGGTADCSGAMSILLIPEQHVNPNSNIGDYY